MKEKISFVAIGQAGGNIGKLLEEKGYSVLYINTSKEDLQTLTGVKYTYHIPQGEGCNKDRLKAKQLVIDDFDNIAKEIDLKLKTKVIYLLFASGGGTGSGAGPMLMDLLLDEKKTVGAVTILPSIKESIKSQINCYECFSELAAIEASSGIFVLDNDKGERLSINSQFVDLLDEFIQIPEKHKSVSGNIDKAELEESMKARGMSLLAKSKDAGTADILKALSSSVFAPMEADQVLKYITISIHGSLDMPEIEKAVGVPLDTFQTYNDSNTLCMLSGLSYPKTRLDAVYQRIAENRETVLRNMQSAAETKLNEDVNFLSGITKPQKEEKPKSKRDIMNKYFKG